MSVTLTKIFLLCCLVSFSKQQLDFYELADKIGKNYNYLETKDVLSLNSSYHMAWIVGEYSVIKETFPNLPTDKLQIINDLMKKADRFIQAALEKYKDNIGIQIGLRPRTWTTAGDFSFKKGFIQEGDPINETLMEIYERSKRSKEFQECEGKFIAINKEADELRKCDLVCGENVNWTDPLSGIMSSDEKVEFLSLEILLNCSNHKAIEIKNYVAKSCSYMKRQVNEMYERRYEPEFADLRYYFLNKILSCGPYGFPEFYTEELVSEIVGSINPDGSVGTSDNTNEEKEVLTTQVAAIMASVMRMLEEGFKI